MNLYKVASLLPALLFFLEFGFSDTVPDDSLIGYGHWGGWGRFRRWGGWAKHAAPYALAAAPYALTAAAAVPYVVPVFGRHVVYLLLFKIIALIKYIKITRLMAFGALIVARGTSLIIGASIGNLATLYYVLYRIHRHHGHYPGWYKPKRRSLLRAWVNQIRWRFARNKPRYGWKPRHYFRWPAHTETYHAQGGWGGWSTPVHSYPVKSSGWIPGKPPGWGSSYSSHGHASSYSVPEYSESSPVVSEEYSAPVGEDSGWQAGDPPSDWKTRSRRHKARIEQDEAKDGGEPFLAETEFMTGMASTAKEIFKDWFSGITTTLISNGAEPKTESSKDRADNATASTEKPDPKVISKRRIKDILAPYIQSEAFLEEQFNKIEETDEEVAEDKASLYVHLRDAYMQTLLDDLAIDSKEKIPVFMPMPKDSGESDFAEPETETSTSKSESYSVSSESQSQSSTRRRRSVDSASAKTKKTTKTGKEPREPTEEELDYVDNLIGQTREFFTLLSAFDQDTCIQKLVCDVHTRAEKPLVDGSYDHNMITMFKLVNALLVGDNKGSSMKYREAAYYGEVNRSEELCKQRYKACESTSKEIIQLGEELDELPNKSKN